eukprot:m.18023 g.18023  ORF g.18023 m.18023 type:complete len:101 (-) comp8409_c1_seq2:266-568(-)
MASSAKHILQAVSRGSRLRDHPQQLHDICNSLRTYGVGSKVARTIWAKWQEPCYYTITKVRKLGPNSVRAWGYLTFRGETSETPKELRSPRKHEWFLLDE